MIPEEQLEQGSARGGRGWEDKHTSRLHTGAQTPALTAIL